MSVAPYDVDVLVIGAGVVGLAVGASLAEAGLEVIVAEQYELIGSQTSSRNSEVIHAGIYYPTGSVKAQLCVRGKQLLYAYCDTYGVPHSRCGKLIVGTNEAQLETIAGYQRQAVANGVHDLVWLGQQQVQALEPEVAAVGGVFSPSTGIVDSHAFMLSLQGRIEAHGGTVALLSRVEQLRKNSVLKVSLSDYELCPRWVINSAGLQAPELAAQVTSAPDSHYAIGHYYSYSGAQPFSRLIYPVAEEGGLGIHVTLDLAGQIKFGPDVRWIDNIDYAFDNSQAEQFAEAIRQYYPGLDATRLQPSYTGIRPKLAPAGSGFQDFLIAGPQHHGVAGLVNLLGIESPGLTASLAIAEFVRDMVVG